MTSSETGIKERDLSHLTSESTLPEGWRSEALRQEASLRSYSRLWPPSESHNSAMLLCHLPEPLVVPEADDFIRLTLLFQQRQIAAPRLLATDAANGLLLLTDCGRHDLAELLRVAPTEDKRHREQLYRGAMLLMSELHSIEPPEFVAARAFDHGKLGAELDFLWQKLPDQWRRDWSPTTSASSGDESLRRACARLTTAMVVPDDWLFTHRDYHSRNLLSGQQMVPRWHTIDYQDARMGLLHYDLASLIFDPYATTSRDERLRLIEIFLDELAEQPIYKGRLARFDEQLLHHAMQRLLKALGSYFWLLFERDFAIFRPSIGAAIERLLELLTHPLISKGTLFQPHGDAAAIVDFIYFLNEKWAIEERA